MDRLLLIYALHKAFKKHGVGFDIDIFDFLKFAADEFKEKQSREVDLILDDFPSITFKVFSSLRERASHIHNRMRYRIGWRLQGAMANIRARALASATSRRSCSRLSVSAENADNDCPAGRMKDLSI